MQMPLHPTWLDITIRLLLTMFAGAVLGFNRGSRGHAAGFRTTIIVGLAAAVSMIQANVLLSLEGRTGESFVVMDLMRLPLGILTGVGFIGGGCILKKGELITGVTTAACLWAVTVIGLCFGGGQLILGVAATFLCFIALWGLKWLDLKIPRNHRARVIISTAQELTPDLNSYISPYGYYAIFQGQKNEGTQRNLEFEVQWKESDEKLMPSKLMELIEKKYKVKEFELTAEKIDHRQ